MGGELDLRVLFGGREERTAVQLKTCISDAHVHRIIGNVVIFPTREFEHPSRRKYRMWEGGDFSSEVVTYDITSTPNLINFRQAIL